MVLGISLLEFASLAGVSQTVKGAKPAGIVETVSCCEISIMEMTNLGACEWFVWDLRRSHLLDPAKLDEVVSQFLSQKPEGEPPALAEYLVDQGLLTTFQSERLLQGKSQDLVLGPFVLMAALGSGSMGTVYRATSKRNKGSFAVKVLPRRSMWNARMARRLVSAFEKFKHPAVVPFVDVGTAGAMHYLAWPLVEGETLEALVQRDGKLDPERAAKLAFQIAEGLEISHQNGLSHGMIKPSNLMVGPDQQVRILDFGIASLLAQDEGESLVDTRSTANALTSGLDCVSPESIVDPSQRTPAGDQYSLGCVLYFCLAGNYPFAEATAAEKIYAHQMKQPTPIREVNPNVPEALAAIIDRLMQKAPQARYAHMGELIDALRQSPTESAFRDSVEPQRTPTLAGSRTEENAEAAEERAADFGDGLEPQAAGIQAAPPLAGSPTDDNAEASPSPLPEDIIDPSATEPGLTPPEAPASTLPLTEPEMPPITPDIPARTSPPPLEIAPPSMAVAQVTASPPISEPAPAREGTRPAAPTDYSLFDIPGVDNPLEARIAEMRKSWVFPLPELNAKLQALMQPQTPEVSPKPSAPREGPGGAMLSPPARSPSPLGGEGGVRGGESVTTGGQSMPPAPLPQPKPPVSPKPQEHPLPYPPPMVERARPEVGAQVTPGAMLSPPAPSLQRQTATMGGESTPPGTPLRELVPVVQPAPEVQTPTLASLAGQASWDDQVRPLWLMVGTLILFVVIFFLGLMLIPH